MLLKNKVTIIGAGMVGSTAAYSLIASNLLEELALIDSHPAYLKAQVMDLQHAIPFHGNTQVKAGTYEDVRDSRVVVITCGAKQQAGETRLDLVKKNSAIIKEILPRVFKANPRAVVIMVTNPVDVLTYLAVSLYPKCARQIMGSGTILDSARFRFLLSQKLQVSPKSIHAYIVGEHGDSELPLWSNATIGGGGIEKFAGLSAAAKKSLFNQAKNAAYAIIAGKQSTYFAIASGVAEIVGAVIMNRRTVLPVSHLLTGEFGLKNVCLSLPVVVGREGIAQKVGLTISPAEKKQLVESARKLKQVFRSVK